MSSSLSFESIDTISAPTQILPYLWLCDLYNLLYTPTFLASTNITAVLSLLDDPFHQPLFTRPEFRAHVPTDRHLLVKCTDTKHEDLFGRFDGLCRWIDGMRREGRVVLVHCEEGVSRSPTVVVAYLVWKGEGEGEGEEKAGMGVREAMEMVKRKRGVVDPRREFVEQLVRWEEVCRGGRRDGGEG